MAFTGPRPRRNTVTKSIRHALIRISPDESQKEASDLQFILPFVTISCFFPFVMVY